MSAFLLKHFSSKHSLKSSPSYGHSRFLKPKIPKSIHNPLQDNTIRPITATPHSLYNFCPSLSYHGCDETPWPESSSGRKGFIWLALLDHRSSLKEARTQMGCTWGRSRCRGHQGVQLTDFFLVTCSACFFIAARATNPKGGATTRGWALLPHESLIKEISHRPAHSPIWWSHFLNWGCFLSDDSSLYKADIN